MRCSYNSRSLVHLVVDDASNAKIAKLHTTLLCNKNICALDISVDDSSLMNPLDSLGYLSQNRDNPFLHKACRCRRFHLEAY